MRSIVTIAATGLLVLAVPAVVFLGGMRRKSPIVLDTVRRFNRSFTNPRVARTAGTSGANASLVRHAGRTTGRCHETPIGVHAFSTGFVVALPYGTRTDWLKNVLASGSATIVDGGATYPVHEPTVVPTSQVARHLPRKELRLLRLFKVDLCLQVMHAEGQPATS